MNEHNIDPETGEVSDDRFNELRRSDAKIGEYLPPATQSGRRARLIGAQPVAVQRRPTSDILATISALGAAAGTDWYYRFPVKKKIKGENGRDEWSTDYIEGPSIKLANDLSREFGNCDIDMEVEETPTHWYFYARFIDLQSGFSMTRAFQQRKSQESIRGSSERQCDIAFQIGQSKAIRNVIVNSLQTYSDYALNKARQSITDKIAKDLPGTRLRFVARCQERGWDHKRIERVLGRTVDQFLAPDLAKASAIFKAIDDGMMSFDEAFPLPTSVTGSEPARNPLDDKPKGESDKPKAESDKPKAESVKTFSEKQQAPLDTARGVADAQQAKASNEAAKQEPAPGPRAEPAGAISSGAAVEQRAEPKPAQAATADEAGPSYEQVAQLAISGATNASKLRKWWKESRPDREEAELSSAALAGLQERYEAKLDAIEGR